VEFADDDGAQKCIATMNGQDLKGRALRVNEAENRPPRPAGASGGPPFRPSFRSGPPGLPPPNIFGDPPPFDDRGRPFRSKGSRRNIRRRKRGFEDD
jgi:RNA recognition motif-containing protein